MRRDIRLHHQEAERQPIKRPEPVDATDAAEKRIRSQVKDGKLEENLMLVEFIAAFGSPKCTIGDRQFRAEPPHGAG